MRPRTLIASLAVLAMLAAAAGCLADPAAETPSGPGTAGTALMAPEALASFVPPAPQGWRLLAPPSPAVLEEDGASLVSVTASYLADSDPGGYGNRSADLVIQDTGGRSVGLRRLVDRLAAAPDNGTVAATLRGRPAYVLDEVGMAGAYILVADQYVVWLAVTGGTRADLDAFVAALDLDGLPGQR